MIKILITGGSGNIAQMIKRNLSSEYNITNLSKNDLNILNLDDIKKYLDNNSFDVLVHTAILGGRRTKDENGEVTHLNLLMYENLLFFANKFKMIINLDSGAIYDRKTDIFNRKEDELVTIPVDYYGFSKYLIYKRSLEYNNIINLRIFNIFHVNEENNRFIKSCFISKKYNTEIQIFDDKYFDFVYEDDFIKIIKYYFDNINNIPILFKVLNICYNKKYKLSEIVKLIINDNSKINIIKSESKNNYSGNGTYLESLNLELIGLEESLKKYKIRIDKIDLKV